MSFPSNVKATNDPPVDKKQQKIITKQNENKTKLVLRGFDYFIGRKKVGKK